MTVTSKRDRNVRFSFLVLNLDLHLLIVFKKKIAMKYETESKQQTLVVIFEHSIIISLVSAKKYDCFGFQ